MLPLPSRAGEPLRFASLLTAQDIVGELGGVEALVALCVPAQGRGVLFGAVASLRHALFGNDQNRGKFVAARGATRFLALLQADLPPDALAHVLATLRRVAPRRAVAEEIARRGAALKFLEAKGATESVRRFAGAVLNIVDKALTPETVEDGAPLQLRALIVRGDTAGGGGAVLRDGGDPNAATAADVANARDFFRRVGEGEVGVSVRETSDVREITAFVKGGGFAVVYFSGAAAADGSWRCGGVSFGPTELAAAFSSRRSEGKLLIIADCPFSGVWVRDCDVFGRDAPFVAAQASCGADEGASCAADSSGGVFSNFFFSSVC